MPRIDYSKMPYKKLISCGEYVIPGEFYRSDTAIQENPEIYRGYWTYNFFGIEFFDDEPDKDME